ncbi:MAG: glycosyltransferase family 117 protein [Longimicrobiaceae bacterium]
MSQSQPSGTERAPHPPYLAALIAAAGVFALYAVTLAPTTAFWDTSEYIATAHILGIPHPPGNPLFVILAKAWEVLLSFTGLSVAVRINLFSAAMSAGAAGFWFLVIHRVLRTFSPREPVRLAGAAVAVLLAATPFTVWNQSNVNEKVYTVSLFTIALLSWLTFLWRDQVEEHRGAPGGRRWHDDNLLVLMVFILALSLGNHLMAFLAAPAMAAVILLVRPRTFLNWKLYGWAALFAVAGLSVNLYLPIRAALDPIINEADPACGSPLAAILATLGLGRLELPGACETLHAVLAREQYAKPPLMERQAPFWAQLANYFQYFDWQWSRSVQGAAGYFAPGRLPFTLLFLGLGGFGALEQWRRDRTGFAYLGVLFATVSVALVFYLNFRYGWGQAQVMGLPLERDVAEVRERDYFFIVSFALWGLWCGVGLTALWLRLARVLESRAAPRPELRSAPVLAVALVPLVLNWPYASRAGDYAARDWAYNLLNSVEPYGVVFTNGDNDTFPLWYLQEVEGLRRDVTVIVHSYLNTPWYAEQIKGLTAPCPEPGAWAVDKTRILCQREFESGRAPEVYRMVEVSPPEESVIPLSLEQIRSLGWQQLPGDSRFQVADLSVTIPAGTLLAPADQLILAIIYQAWGERPIYFAATTNNHRRLGFGGNAVRQGLAYKLVAEGDAGEFLAMPQELPISSILGAYLDVERTRTLLYDTFVYRDLTKSPHWVDASTRSIPSYYGYAHYALTQAEEMLGNGERADRSLARAEEWMELSSR